MVQSSNEQRNKEGETDEMHACAHGLTVQADEPHCCRAERKRARRERHSVVSRRGSRQLAFLRTRSCRVTGICSQRLGELHSCVPNTVAPFQTTRTECTALHVAPHEISRPACFVFSALLVLLLVLSLVAAALCQLSIGVASCTYPHDDCTLA